VNRHSRGTALTAATLVVLALAGTALGSDPDRWIWLVPVLAIYAATWITAYNRLTIGPKTVFVVAVLLRLAMMPLEPVLSDDAYRYIWDGAVQSVANPYDHTPSEFAERYGHSSHLLSNMNSAEYHSVYPPFSQLFFRAAAEVGGEWPASYFALKLLFVLVELAGVIALLAIVAPRVALLYAWNPLVVVVVAGQGHTESLAAGMLLLSFWAFRRRHAFAGGSAVALAGMAKLYPFVLAPIIIQRVGWRALLGGLSVVGILTWLYWSPQAIPNAVESLRLYTQFFEFNAGLYYALKWMGWFVFGEDISKTLGPMLAIATIVWFIVVSVVSTRRQWPLAQAAVSMFGGYLVLATTVHPWYIVPLLACVAANGRPSWHWQVLALASLGTYARYVEGPYGLFVAIGWIGVLVAFAYFNRGRIIDGLLRWRARLKTRLFERHVPEDARLLLDLGAAEGYVGDELARRLDLDLTLVDVCDANRTDRRLVVYDGARLPFDENAFDVVILSFVLHHAKGPDTVLAEATRVARSRLIILESVYKSDTERRLLEIVDRTVNRLRGDWITSDDADLHFRKAQEWEEGIQAAGGKILDQRHWGRFWHRKALFVVDVSGQPAADPRS
jgi:alpha-1,6-mannosyltransferase